MIQCIDKKSFYYWISCSLDHLRRNNTIIIITIESIHQNDRILKSNRLLFSFVSRQPFDIHSHRKQDFSKLVLLPNFAELDLLQNSICYMNPTYCSSRWARTTDLPVIGPVPSLTKLRRKQNLGIDVRSRLLGSEDVMDTHIYWVFIFFFESSPLTWFIPCHPHTPILHQLKVDKICCRRNLYN